MPSIQRILVPLDLSACAPTVFEYALFVADRFGAAVDVLHVLERPPVVATPEGGVPLSAPQGGRIEAASALERMTAEHRGRVRSRIESGDPHDTILRLAAAESFDLIVMGTHGRTGLGHLLLGSVAERVVRHAPCPVVTVRATEHKT